MEEWKIFVYIYICSYEGLFEHILRLDGNVERPGEPGSLGQHRPEACDPSTRFSIELSVSFAACL